MQFDDQLPLAQVQQSQAELSIAQANHKRNQELVAQNFVSQRSLDESAANLQVAQAKLALAQATAARLKIVAPFDGIAGIRNVNVGDYLKDGADIVNLEDIDTIYVDFRLPERFQTKLKPGQTAAVELDALPGRRFEAQVQADRSADRRQWPLDRRACLHRQPASSCCVPACLRASTRCSASVNRRVVIPEEAIVPQGGRQFVIKLVPGAGEGQPGVAARRGQGGHPPSGPGGDPRRAQARRHRGDGRPAAPAARRHAGQGAWTLSAPRPSPDSLKDGAAHATG